LAHILVLFLTLKNDSSFYLNHIKSGDFNFQSSTVMFLKSDAQTLKSVTDRQTKKLNAFGHPGGGCNPSPTKLGMVIEDLEHVLSPLKRLGSNA